MMSILINPFSRLGTLISYTRITSYLGLCHGPQVMLGEVRTGQLFKEVQEATVLVLKVGVS